MAYQIVWTDNAAEDYESVITYLYLKWNVAVALDFINIVNAKLDTLSLQPNIGLVTDDNENIRSILITKHNRLFYSITNNIIEVLDIFDTRQHPLKKPF